MLDSYFINLFVNGLYGLECSFWILFRDVIVNVIKLLFCFVGPVQFDHERIRRSISLLEIVLPCLESASPCSIILWKANSLRISSYELSFGWLCMIWIICSFTEAMIISHALQQFLFCGSEVHDRDRGAVCPGGSRSQQACCLSRNWWHWWWMHERTCPWIWVRVFRTWDLMIRRYEGIRGSALVGMLYCCVGSDGMVRGCPDQQVRYDEGCLRDRSFEEICRGGVLGDIRGVFSWACPRDCYEVDRTRHIAIIPEASGLLPFDFRLAPLLRQYFCRLFRFLRYHFGKFISCQDNIVLFIQYNVLIIES